METSDVTWEDAMVMLSFAGVEYIFDELHEEMIVFTNEDYKRDIGQSFDTPQTALEYVFETLPKFKNS